MMFDSVKKFNAAIFDLDGTLVSTRPEYRYLVVGNTLRELGIPVLESEIDLFWFRGNRTEIVRKYFKINPDLFWKTFRKHDSPEVRKDFTTPFNDVDLLRNLKNKGLKIGIVTRAPEHIIEAEISLIGKNIFDSIILANHVSGIKEKPHPEGLHKCLRALNINPENAFFVGNAEEDVMAAKNAKILDILIDRGEYESMNIRPTLRINSLYELSKHLDF
jgi:HAD superfamily hydrolase (TIGR01549 family)